MNDSILKCKVIKLVSDKDLNLKFNYDKHKDLLLPPVQMDLLTGYKNQSP